MRAAASVSESAVCERFRISFCLLVCKWQFVTLISNSFVANAPFLQLIVAIFTQIYQGAHLR
jgi:hypothetical protein